MVSPIFLQGGLLIKHPHTPSMTSGATSPQGTIYQFWRRKNTRNRNPAITRSAVAELTYHSAAAPSARIVREPERSTSAGQDRCAATRVSNLKVWEKCCPGEFVCLQEFCKLQKPTSKRRTSLMRKRSVVRIHYRPLFWLLSRSASQLVS